LEFEPFAEIALIDTRPRPMEKDSLLIVADSEHDANMLYAVGMFVPDPFIYLRARGRCHMVVNDLEINRARRLARHCEVLSLSQYQEKVRREHRKITGLAPVIRMLLKERKLKRLLVPENFPHGLARELRRLKIKVKVRKGCFFPKREIKSSTEIKKISAALMMAEVGLAEGIQALKNARIARDRRLIHHNVPLTSEKLRAIINTAIIQAGGLVTHTIVACGRQTCDPHEEGHGALRAGEPIILDVFPRSRKTGYFGDISRTVVRGRASEAIRKLYHTVARGQELAFSKLRNRVPGADVHRTVEEFFTEAGYVTSKPNGRLQGFFHGTGHGLGMEVHEAPRICRNSADILKAGQVVTVEPGLYYPNIGGVRLEDVACITKNGARNLTKFDKAFEI
jgi:Xaa-Pro aminopeptidase